MMIEAKKAKAQPYMLNGMASEKQHSQTKRAVHVQVLKPPQRQTKSRSKSRSPRAKAKKTGFVDLKNASNQVKMDHAMSKHMRDDKKPNPKQLEKSMSLQVREYLAQIEARVANVSAKEVGLRYGYDVDNPDNTLEDLIEFTGKVSEACGRQIDITENRQQVWQSTVVGSGADMDKKIGSTY